MLKRRGQQRCEHGCSYKWSKTTMSLEAGQIVLHQMELRVRRMQGTRQGRKAKGKEENARFRHEQLGRGGEGEEDWLNGLNFSIPRTIANARSTARHRLSR